MEYTGVYRDIAKYTGICWDMYKGIDAHIYPVLKVGCFQGIGQAD